MSSSSMSARRSLKLFVITVCLLIPAACNAPPGTPESVAVVQEDSNRDGRMFRAFHHIGLPTEDPQPDETYVEETKVWVTDPADHPFRVEYLRYEADSPVTGPLREKPHVAYRVDDLAAALEGKELLLEPFTPMPGLSVAFFEEDGVVIEYMQFEGDATEFDDLN